MPKFALVQKKPPYLSPLTTLDPSLIPFCTTSNLDTIIGDKDVSKAIVYFPG
jgi:hypothetical protein